MITNRYTRVTSLFLPALLAIFIVGCSKEAPLQIPDSTRELELTESQKTETDLWIKENLTDVYNIEAIWRWDNKENKYDKNYIPPKESDVIPFLATVDHTFLQSYVEYMGRDWFYPLVPKQLQLLGEWGYNTGGTITLGQAEAGQKIVFYGTDYWDAHPQYGYPNIREAIHTMFHEFGHILHQNKLYSEDFEQITPEGYTAQWTNGTEVEARIEGFVSMYSRADKNEDFVELIAFYTTLDEENWQSLIDEGVASATSDLVEAQNSDDEAAIRKAMLELEKANTGKANILKKITMVKDYAKTQWDLDLDEVRAIVLRRSEEVFDNPTIFPQANRASSLRSLVQSDIESLRFVKSPFDFNKRYCSCHNHAPAPTPGVEEAAKAERVKQ